MLIVWHPYPPGIIFTTASNIFYNTQRASLIHPQTGIEALLSDKW